MKVYICEHKDSNFNEPDYFVTKNYEAGISWLREKAKKCSGNASQLVSHFFVAGAGTSLAMNSMLLIALNAGVSCNVDPLAFKAGATKMLSNRERRVLDGKVQNWRDCQMVQK